MSSWSLECAGRSPVPGAVLVLAVLAVAGCAGASAPPGPPAPANRAAAAPGVLAARTTAQTEFGLLAGGDYAHAWELWSAAAQRAISRTEFVALNTACPVGVGVAATVESALSISDIVVLIEWRRPATPGGDPLSTDQPSAAPTGAASSSAVPTSATPTGRPSNGTHFGMIRMIYARGAWRFEPADADLRGGIRGQLARRRSAHQCPRLDARQVT